MKALAFIDDLIVLGGLMFGMHALWWIHIVKAVL